MYNFLLMDCGVRASDIITHMFAEVAEQLREFKAEILPMVSNAMSYGDVPVFRIDPVRHDKGIITDAPKVSLFRVTSGKIT